MSPMSLCLRGQSGKMNLNTPQKQTVERQQQWAHHAKLYPDLLRQGTVTSASAVPQCWRQGKDVGEGETG